MLRSLSGSAGGGGSPNRKAGRGLFCSYVSARPRRSAAVSLGACPLREPPDGGRFRNLLSGSVRSSASGGDGTNVPA